MAFFLGLILLLAIIIAGLDMELMPGLTFGTTFSGEFSGKGSSYAGFGVFRYAR